MPNIVAFAPMPSPSVAITAAAKPGLRRSPRNAYRSILRERAPPLGAPLLSGARAIDRRQPLARALHVAEPALGFFARLVGRHSVGHEIPHRHVEVKPQLVVDRALDAGASRA